MNNREIIANIANDTSMSKEEVEQFVESFSEVLIENIINNQIVDIQNIGHFELKKEEEKIIIDDKSGDRKLFPPRLKVEFVENPHLNIKINSI